MYKAKEVVIQYYNVKFYLHARNECDSSTITYFLQNINSDIRLEDIYRWCNNHNINYVTRFEYRKDYPLSANLWNYYSYTRARISVRMS